MKNSGKQKSFTLVETLLAIAILTMTVIAPLSIASRGLSAATTGKDRFIATGLAREAMEYIRNVRDTNRLLNTDNIITTNDVNWLNGILHSGQTANLNGPCVSSCVVDAIDSHGDASKVNPRSQSEKKNGVLGYESSLGLFGYASVSNPNDFWADSRFTRYVTVQEIVAGREARVTVTVEWKTLFATKRVVMTEQLLNW